MVINYCNFYRTRFRPPEDNTPLVVYANRMKTRASTFEGFEAVTGWSCKVSKFIGLIQLNQFS